MNAFCKKNWHCALIALLIGFACGVTFEKVRDENRMGPPHMGDHSKMKERMLNRFSKDLGLSGDQKAQVKEIFEAHHPQMVALHKEMQPKMEVVRAETDAQIRKILTDEQQKKFDERNAKRAERMKKWDGDGPPPPP